MKKAVLIIFLFTAVAGMTLAQTAQTGRLGGNTGLGIIFGEPTGVSFKYWTGRSMAIDAAAAWSFADGSSFQFHMDLIFHSWDVFRVERVQMALYYGFGGRIKTKDVNGDFVMSFRLPLGIAYEIARSPVEVFVEIAPMLNLVPKTEAAIGGGVGFRYFF